MLLSVNEKTPMAVYLAISTKILNIYSLCLSNLFPQNYSTNDLAFEKNNIYKIIKSYFD